MEFKINELYVAVLSVYREFIHERAGLGRSIKHTLFLTEKHLLVYSCGDSIKPLKGRGRKLWLNETLHVFTMQDSRNSY